MAAIAILYGHSVGPIHGNIRFWRFISEKHDILNETIENSICITVQPNEEVPFLTAVDLNLCHVVKAIHEFLLFSMNHWDICLQGYCGSLHCL